MSQSSQPIETLEELRNLVNTTLCEYEKLEINAFPMTERILMRGERPCGIYFCLHGPRAVKFSAIWETDRNTILFYGADGQRYHRLQLLAAPSLQPMAA